MYENIDDVDWMTFRFKTWWFIRLTANFQASRTSPHHPIATAFKYRDKMNPRPFVSSVHLRTWTIYANDWHHKFYSYLLQSSLKFKKIAVLNKLHIYIYIYISSYKENSALQARVGRNRLNSDTLLINSSSKLMILSYGPILIPLHLCGMRLSLNKIKLSDTSLFGSSIISQTVIDCLDNYN